MQIPGRVMKLNPPRNGLTSFVNVMRHVGPDQPNSPGDVRVIQRLLQMCGKGSQIAGQIGLPAVTGHFDAATGFWIYRSQCSMKASGCPSQIVDGVVSPAHGAFYGPGAEYLIVAYNELAQQRDPINYAKFVQEYADLVY